MTGYGTLTKSEEVFKGGFYENNYHGKGELRR